MSVSQDLELVALEAAFAANRAWDALRQAEEGLEVLGQASRLELPGVVIEPDAWTTLENQRQGALNGFNTLGDMAGHVLGQGSEPNPGPIVGSPPKAEQSSRPQPPMPIQPEGQEVTGVVIDTELRDRLTNGGLLRNRQEIKDFAQARGYPPKWAGSAWGIIERVAAVVRIRDLAAYKPVGSEGLRMAARQLSGGREEFYVDLQSLHSVVQSWLLNLPSDIRNLGPRTVSFLADYLNHSLLESNALLTVAYPPESLPQKPTLESMSSAQIGALVLRKVEINGGEASVVTHETMREFAVAQGVSAQKTSGFRRIFASIVEGLQPGCTRQLFPEEGPIPVGSEGLISLERTVDPNERGPRVGITSTWGIGPERFMQAIDLAESNPDPKRALPGYTDLARPIVLDYIRTLKKVLDNQEVQ